MPSSVLVIATGHGDRDRMIKETRHKYAKIAPSLWRCCARNVRKRERDEEFAVVHAKEQQQTDYGISEPSHEFL